MPLYQLFFYLLFGAALFGGGGAVIHNLAPAPREQAEVQRLVPAVRPAEAPARAASPDRGATPAQTVQPASVPSFDVVRIEENGDGVIAGRAEPGWTVTIEAGDDKIGTAVADRNGEWAVVLDKPLLPGEHSIGLRSMSPSKSQGSVSEQRVAISVAKPKTQDETIVALSQPGKPTRVLTPRESSEAPPAETRTREFQPPSEAAEPAPRESMAAAEPAAPRAPKDAAGLPEQVVAFDAVDYEVNAAGEGKLFLSGQAEPGMRITLYLDNNRVGEAVAAPNGLWTFESLRTLLPEKSHTMRADAVQSDGQVASRAEVPFQPQPTPPAPVVSKAAPAPPAPETEPKKQEPRIAAAPVPPVAETQTKQQEPKMAVAPAPPAPEAEPKKQEPRTAAAPVPPVAETQSKQQEPKMAVAPAPPAAETVPKEQATQAAAEPAVSPRATVTREAATTPPSTSKTEGQQKESRMAAASAFAPEAGGKTREETQSPPPRAARAPETTGTAPEPVASARETVPAAPAPETATPAPAVTAAAPVVAAPVETGQGQTAKQRPILRQIRSIVVRRGDTLWHIAERRYGHGKRYTVIYKSNRRQIRNPHLIYPGQEFRLPSR